MRTQTGKYRRDISLPVELSDTMWDCLNDKERPDWEGWDAYLNSKNCQEWVENIVSRVVDVATDHMEAGLERMKE